MPLTADRHRFAAVTTARPKPRRRLRLAGLLVGIILVAGAVRLTLLRPHAIPVTVFHAAPGRVEDTVVNSRAGTVQSSGPVGSASTRISASSGSHRSTGSDRAILPSCTSVIAAATVTGLVIEAIRKIVSRRIGRPASASRWPIALTWSTSPRCQTSVTAPASRPEATASSMESRLSARFTAGSLRQRCRSRVRAIRPGC